MFKKMTKHAIKILPWSRFNVLGDYNAKTTTPQFFLAQSTI